QIHSCRRPLRPDGITIGYGECRENRTRGVCRQCPIEVSKPARTGINRRHHDDGGSETDPERSAMKKLHDGSGISSTPTRTSLFSFSMAGNVCSGPQLLPAGCPVERSKRKL